MSKKETVRKTISDGLDVVCRRRGKTLPELIADDIMENEGNLYKYISLKARLEEKQAQLSSVEDPDEAVRRMMNAARFRDEEGNSKAH